MAGASPTAPIADMVRPARQWNVVDSHRNRRITVQTPMTFSGPAVGHRLLRTDADPGGTTPISTVNSCSMGKTPWGTYVTCEENFNGYFWNLGEGADVLGATPMDRPEWTAVDPKTKDVHCTLTNNTRREADDTDAANTRGPNQWGHIIRWREADGDNASADAFDWDLRGTPEEPTAESSWPDGTRPRPATLVITKEDGFRIGT